MNWEAIKLHLATCLAAALLPACNPVVSTHPVGTPITRDLSGTLDGVWVTGDAHFVLKYVENGLIRIAVVEWSDGDFHLGVADGVISELGDSTYLNVRDPDSEEAEYWFLLLAVAEGSESIVIFEPSYSYFNSLIEAGTVQGLISRGSATLTADKTSLDRLMTAVQTGNAFKLSEPLVLHRVLD